MAVKNLFKKLNGNPIPEYRALDVLDDWLDDDFDANLLKKAAFSDNATLPKAWLAKLTDSALIQETDQLTKVVRSAPNLALMYLRLNEKFQGEAMNALRNNASQEEVVNFFKKAIDDTSNNNATALFFANPARSRLEFVGAMLTGFSISENAMSNRTFVLKVFNNVKWAALGVDWAKQNSSWSPFLKQKFDARYFMQTLGNMFAIGDVSIEAKKLWAEAAKILWEASPKKDDATFQKQAAHSLEVLVNTSGIDADSVALAHDLLGAIKGTSTSSSQDASPSTEVDVDSVFGFFLKHRAELAASLKKTSQKDRMATYMAMYQKSGTLIADAEAYVWANLISTTGKVHNHCVNVVAQADLQGSLKLSDLITSIKEATSSDVKMRGSAKVVKHLNIVFAVPSGQDAGHGKDNVVEFNKIGNFNALMLTATLDDGNQAIIPLHEVAAKIGLDDAAYFDAMMELGAILHKNQNKTQACLDQLATWLTQKLSPRGSASAVIQGDTETETPESADGKDFVKKTNAAIKPLLSATDLHDFYAKCTELYPNIGEAYINYPFWVDDTEDAVIGVLQFSFELASKVEAADVYRMAAEAGVNMTVMASMPDYVFSGAGVFIDAKRYDNWKAVSKSKRSLNLIADGDFQVPLLKPAYQTDKVIDTLIAAAYDGGGDVSAVLSALAKLYPVEVAKPTTPPATPAPSVKNDAKTIVPSTVEEAAKKVVAETVTQGDVVETKSGTSVVVDHDQTEIEIIRQAFFDYGLTDLTELENPTRKRSFSQFAAFAIAMTGVLEAFAFGFSAAQEDSANYPDFADPRVVYLFPPKSQHTEAIQVALETLLGDFLRSMHGAANKKNKRWGSDALMESLPNVPEQIIWNSYFSEPLPRMASIDGELVDLGEYFDEQRKERLFGQAFLLLKDCTTTYEDVRGNELEVPFGQAICWTVYTCAIALAKQYADMPEDAFVTKAASVLASYVNKVPAPRVLSLIEYADAERDKQAASVDDLATGFNTPDPTPTGGMDSATFAAELAKLQKIVDGDDFGVLDVIHHEDGDSPADTLGVLLSENADLAVSELLLPSSLYSKVVEYGSFHTAIEEGYLSEEQVADVLRVLTKGEVDLTSDTNYVEPTEPTPTEPTPTEPIVNNTPTFQAPTTDTSTTTVIDDDTSSDARISFDDEDDDVQPPVITPEAQDTLDNLTKTVPVTNLTKPADENPKVEGIADDLSIMATQYATKVKSASSRVAAETPSRVALRENTTADTHMTFSGSKARFLTNVLRQIGGNSEVLNADTLNDILADELGDSVDFYFYNNDSFSQWELSIAVQGIEVYKTSFDYSKSANAENVPIAYISLMLVLNNGGMRDVFLDGGDETYPKDYAARLVGAAFTKHTDLDSMLNEFMVGGGSTPPVTFDDDTSPSTDSTLDSELNATDYAERVFKEALAKEAANVVTLDRIKAALTDVNDNSEASDYTIRTREDLAAFIKDSAAYAAGEATGIKDADLLAGLFNGLAASETLAENDNTAERVKDFLETVVADEEDGYMDVAVSAMIDALGVYLEDDDDDEDDDAQVVEEVVAYINELETNLTSESKVVLRMLKMDEVSDDDFIRDFVDYHIQDTNDTPEDLEYIYENDLHLWDLYVENEDDGDELTTYSIRSSGRRFDIETDQSSIPVEVKTALRYYAKSLYRSYESAKEDADDSDIDFDDPNAAIKNAEAYQNVTNYLKEASRKKGLPQIDFNLNELVKSIANKGDFSPNDIANYIAKQAISIIWNNDVLHPDDEPDSNDVIEFDAAEAQLLRSLVNSYLVDDNDDNESLNSVLKIAEEDDGSTYYNEDNVEIARFATSDAFTWEDMERDWRGLFANIILKRTTNPLSSGSQPEPKQEPKPTSVDTNALVEKANELLAKLLSGVRTTQQPQQQPQQQQPQQQQKKSFSFKSAREGKTTTQQIDTSTLKDAKDTAQTQTKRAGFNSNVSANLKEVSAAANTNIENRIFHEKEANVRSVIANEANAKGIDFSELAEKKLSSSNQSENFLKAYVEQESPMLFTQGIADLVLSPAVEKELERILGDSAAAYRALSPADKVAEVAKALVAYPSAEVSDWWF